MCPRSLDYLLGEIFVRLHDAHTTGSPTAIRTQYDEIHQESPVLIFKTLLCFLLRTHTIFSHYDVRGNDCFLPFDNQLLD
jgi:hypothetical protein